MNEEKKAVWINAIKMFLNDRHETDYVRYLKGVFKDIAALYERQRFYGDDELAFIFDTRKNKKAENQKESEFILQQITALQRFTDIPNELDLYEELEQIQAKNQELLDKYAPQLWLTWAAENAKNITFATHVAKLTHSAIDSASFFDSSTEQKNSHLSTASLSRIAIDGAVRGNQYAPIYQFLELEVNGEKLIGHFHDEETDLLASFAENEDQAQVWNQGFAAALNEGQPTAHFLLKQTYYPITDGKQEYHLLANVVSSSMAQALFEFTRRNTATTMKLRGGKKYSSEPYFNFPNRASIAITASNHGNASQLNGTRGGRLGLFSCQPPTWHSQLKPPIFISNCFYALSHHYEVRETLQYLADFLVRFETLELSIKDPKRMHWVERWVESLSDEALFYVKSIQALPAGWSATEGIRLKTEHQILLDCDRQDEVFEQLKFTTNWQTVVIEDFAYWLNNRLFKMNNKFTAQNEHTRLWVRLFESNLREAGGIL